MSLSSAYVFVIITKAINEIMINIDLFFLIRDLSEYILDSDYRYIIYWCLYFLFALILVLPTFNCIRKITYIFIGVIVGIMGATDLALLFAYFIKYFHYEIFSEHMSHFLPYIYAEPIYAFDILFWENLCVLAFPLFLKFLDFYHNKWVDTVSIILFTLYEHKVFWLCFIILEILASNIVCFGYFRCFL